ncbi:MAG: sulfurtransferase TusA family protein [Candidatus Omnitrophica bacterium]|nr:sulfurtransferase TusA family protein [Candidatus Omnitrophota bacterium]
MILPDKIIEDINNYKKSLNEYLEKDMDFARFKGIRVPWGFYSHRGKKVYMARIRIPGGVVEPIQLKTIADASLKYGNGTCHITTRQDIQIHGVKIEDTGRLMDDLKGVSLSPRGGGGNTVRNITACPLSGICKDEVINVNAQAETLTEYLLQQDDSYNLPRKFKIAFSGCSKDCSGCLINDVGFLASELNGEYGFRVFAGGGMGAKSAIGRLLENFIPAEDIGYCVSAVKNIYYENGDRKNRHHNRLKFLIQDIGFEKFRELYDKEIKKLKDSEYISLRKKPAIQREENNGEITMVDDGQYKEFLKYNVQPQKQDGYSIIELRMPRGDISAENLLKISGLENVFPGIEFRTSVSQNLYVAWVKNQDVYNLYTKIKEILTDFLYPGTLLDTIVCKGALTCNLGICNSPGLSVAIETMLKKEFIGKSVFNRLNVHINGCPNSCGQAPIGQIGFYGLTRRVLNRPLPFYKILLGGRKSAEFTEFGDEIEIIPAKNVPGFLQKFLSIIENEIKGIEDIDQYLKTRGKEITKNIIGGFSYVPPYSENRDFYVDWGKTEEFSLEGVGQGECGAGVLDIIESDIVSSKTLLTQAKKETYPAEKIKKSIFFSARALLIVKSKEPMAEQEAIEYFYEIFIKTGIASEKYSNIKEVFSGISESLPEEKRKEKFIYATGFLEHIKDLYKSMDSSFNFPKGTSRTEQKLPDKERLLDLKGTPCPINYVKAKLFLENIAVGEIVNILLDEGEPIDNVPKSLTSDGHKILNIEKKDGFYRVSVQKEGGYK